MTASASAPRAAPEGGYDVVVIGGGNAALVAAMSARHHLDKVLLVERASEQMRGGNTRHTRNVRCVHQAADAYNTGAYPYDELWDDLCHVGTGPSNEALAALTVRESETIPQWMSHHGIHWQTPLSGTLHLGRTNRFFLGGGKALLNSYYAAARQMGISIAYDTRADDLVERDGRITAVRVSGAHGEREIPTKAVICAAGGFEANIEWLARYWGAAAYNYAIRGPDTNDGRVLEILYRLGADRAGEEKGFHAVAVDARSPLYDGGIATRLDSIPFSIVVNRREARFYDEGEELWPKRYAIWGRNIAEQQDQLAWSIWDEKVNRNFLPPMYGPSRADSIEELAGLLGLDPVRLGGTVRAYNDAVVPGVFDLTRLDGCHTEGLTPNKTNWAQRIDQPPFYGIAMRPGITFTYLGVAVDEHGAVRRVDGSTFANLFAAGEIMSGNVLSSGYLAGFGLTIGSVWGRIAGTSAAKEVHDEPRR